MSDKQKKVKAAHQINQSLALIASLGSNIEHYLPELQDDPEALTAVSNRLAEEIGTLREVYTQIVTRRFQSLLPDSGVKFEIVDPPAAVNGVED